MKSITLLYPSFKEYVHINNNMFLFILLFNCSPTFLEANINVDSLEKALLTEENVDTLFNIQTQLYDYYYSRDAKQAIAIAERNLALAQSLANNSKISDALVNLIKSHEKTRQASKALEYLRDLRSFDPPHLSAKQQKTVLSSEALIYFYMDKDIKAQAIFYELIELSQATQDLFWERKANYSLGHVFLEQGDYEKALEYFNKANDLYRKNNNTKDGYSAAHYSIASVYTQMGQYDQSEEYAKKAFEMASHENNKKSQIRALDKLAESYFYQDKIDLTEEIIDQALSLNDSYQDISLEVEFNFNKGYIHEKRGNFRLALNMYEAILLDIKKHGLTGFRQPVYTRLTECSEELGEYKKAVNYQNILSSLKDSLYNEKNAQQLRFNQIQFETAQKEQQNDILAATVSKQKSDQFALVSLFLAVIGAFVAFISFLKVRQIRKIDHMRMNIAQDLHDEVGSNLTQIQLFANDLFLKKAITDGVEENSHKITSMIRDTHFVISDLVWAINPKKNKVKDLINRLNDYTDDLLIPSGIAYDFDIGIFQLEKQLDPIIRQNIMLLFKECINNILKHTNSSSVKISLLNSNGNFILEIVNNYNSLKFDVISSGLGLKNMEQRAKKIGGVLLIENGKDFFKVHLTMKAFA